MNITAHNSRVFRLINTLEYALDKYMTEVSQRGYSEDYGDSVHEYASMLMEMGVGKVRVKAWNGRYSWLNLEDCSF